MKILEDSIKRDEFLSTTLERLKGYDLKTHIHGKEKIDAVLAKRAAAMKALRENPENQFLQVEAKEATAEYNALNRISVDMMLKGIVEIVNINLENHYTTIMYVNYGYYLYKHTHWQKIDDEVIDNMYLRECAAIIGGEQYAPKTFNIKFTKQLAETYKAVVSL